MNRNLVRYATAGLLAATTATIILSGAASASARPTFPNLPQPVPPAPQPAPPVTTTQNQSFVVPENDIHPGESLPVFGMYNLFGLPGDDSRSYGVTMSCDDGANVPLTLSYDKGGLHGASFGGSIPAEEQGKTCTIHGTAPAERMLTFGAPTLRHFLESSDSSALGIDLAFIGGVTVTTSTGGL